MLQLGTSGMQDRANVQDTSQHGLLSSCGRLWPTCAAGRAESSSPVALPKLLMRELRRAAAKGVFEAFTMACRTVLRLLFTTPCNPSCWHVPSGHSMYKDFVACRAKAMLLRSRRSVSKLYRAVTCLAVTCLQQLSVCEEKQGYAELNTCDSLPVD